MMLRPLSTYITWPVTAEARGETRKAATLPTSCRSQAAPTAQQRHDHRNASSTTA
jgi:hypothetical protein